MKNQINKFLLLMIVNEVCDTTENPVKNIGGKKQCLEAPIQAYALARKNFAFDSIDDAKNPESWATAIENKDIVPFPDIEGIDDNSTDPEIFEGRFADKTLKDAVAGSDYTLNLAICTYEAAVSYENSEYTRMFQISTLNELGCEVTDDGKVRGRLLKSFLVGNRNEATDSDPANAHITTKYGSRFFSILKLPFEAIELEGIYDVGLIQESASATEVVFRATEACGGTAVTDVESARFKLFEANGTEDETATFSGASPEGTYTVTSTGIADGWYIELDGVVVTTNNTYETGYKLVIKLD